MGYQCLDTFGEARTGCASNCYHAITYCDAGFNRPPNPVRRLAFGDTASAYLAEEVIESGGVIDAECRHWWLIPALGLDPEATILR